MANTAETTPDVRNRPRAVFVRANHHDCTNAIPRALEASKSLFGDVHILCWNRTGAALSDVEHTEDATILRFQGTAPPRSLRIVLRTLLYQMWVLRHLLRLRGDVVQVLDFESALPATVACLLTRARLVYDMRDPFAMCYRFPLGLGAVAYAIDWIVMSVASAFVVPAESRVPYLGRWGRSNRAVVVVPNTCHDEPAATEQSSGTPGAEDDAVRIALLGYIDPARGAGVLMDLCREEPGRVEVFVAGACRNELLKEQLQNTPGFHLLGKLPRSEALTLMRRCDLVSLTYDPCVPVNRIAAPNKFYEAMMTGTPVLVSDGMVQADTVREHGLGYVVKYGDGADLAKVVAGVRNRLEHERIGRRCRAYFLDCCQLSGEMAKYRSWYRTVLEKCA